MDNTEKDQNFLEAQKEMEEWVDKIFKNVSVDERTSLLHYFLTSTSGSTIMSNETSGSTIERKI